jgi:hypothetical protein
MSLETALAMAPQQQSTAGFRGTQVVPQFVILEDDSLQTQTLRGVLEKHFQLTECRIKVLTAESDFREWLDREASEADLKSAVFVLDMMVRWSRVRRDIPEMPELINREGFRRAGLRCARMIEDRCADARIILHTILDEDDLADVDIGPLKVVTKTPDLGHLVHAIKELLSRR